MMANGKNIFTGRVCSLSVMDESASDTSFDSEGVSNHFRAAQFRLRNEQLSEQDRPQALASLAERIRNDGKGRDYDCIMGLSGGADSSYVGVVAKNLGLRPLAVHLDNGWNTETACTNIERLTNGLGIDLWTHVIKWPEFRDVQRSLFLASVPNVEVATDHAIFALLYQVAAKFGVKYILSGSNLATETIMPDSWGYDTRDSRHIRGIKNHFGDPAIKLDTFPLLSPVGFLRSILVDKIKLVPILNLVGYDKPKAVAEMQTKFAYKSYARKHGESRFTRFFQEYYLVEKFGFDKRKAHLSSMIASGLMTRDQAIGALTQNLYSENEKRLDVDYVARKLNFSPAEWQAIMKTPMRSYKDFPNNAWMFDHKASYVQAIRRFAKL
jgi:aminotransferase